MARIRRAYRGEVANVAHDIVSAANDYVGVPGADTSPLPSLDPDREPPGPYAELAEVASNIVWEMRDGDRVLYAVRVATLVAPTSSVQFRSRLEGDGSRR